jgi:teichuronic acid biosynthesis glycosyltransferase TuaC
MSTKYLGEASWVGGRFVKARVLVLSSLFPSDVQPAAGLFIRERMFRVGESRKVVVLAPQAWFPGQSLIRIWRPHFRPMAKVYEQMGGIEVFRPRYLSFPMFFKRVDGLAMALCSFLTARTLVKTHELNVIDVHFGYPDGTAGAYLSRWLRLPMVLTLRGKEARQAKSNLRGALIRALTQARRVVTVSNALRDLAVELGSDLRKLCVIGNGIDLQKFFPIEREVARDRLGLPRSAKVLVTVGTLIERKGFHRVFEVMPLLAHVYNDLHYLVVGGSGPEGDYTNRLKSEVERLGLTERVHFLGSHRPEQLHVPLSAADVFVLASGYEGWANVILEAMACGLPVVATDVGGNGQVVSCPSLGEVVAFGDAAALRAALERALANEWNRDAIRAYAEANSWDRRIPQLIELLDQSARGNGTYFAGYAWPFL